MHDSIRSLNLGCGQYPLAGFLNVDIDSSAKSDLRVDLNHIPFPFRDCSFEVIQSSHLLEHLSDPFGFMRETHRLLVPDGRLIIKVPHFSRGLTHPQHARGFDVSFPMYFNRNFTGGYTGTDFELLSMKLC